MASRSLPWNLVRLGMVLAGLSLGCSEGTPATGARIEVTSEAGLPVPQYLLVDWMQDERVVFAGRRVPENGQLDPAAAPLAVVRIAVDDANEPNRRVIVRGMIENQLVSQGTGSLQVVPGTWQTVAVVLGPPLPQKVDADAGVPQDGPDLEGGAQQPDGGSPGATDAAQADGSADAGSLPADVAPADLAVDLATPPPTDAASDTTTHGIMVLPVVADSYVEQGDSAATKNYGKATVLEVKNQGGADNNRVAYLRFSLAPLAGASAMTATLRLYGRSAGGTTSESVAPVMDETWTEAGINWNNKPALGAKIATAAITATAQYRDWNVTALVKARQAANKDTVDLAVSMDAETAASPDVHNSREAASNPPQLVVTW
jgi:hypothetical protein